MSAFPKRSLTLWKKSLTEKGHVKLNIQNALGFLGICRRAGFLLCGHDVVKESVTSGKAELVFLAKDASERLIGEMQRLCNSENRNIPILRTVCTMEDFYKALGKKSAVFSVTDTGFSTTILTKYREELDDNKI